MRFRLAAIGFAAIYVPVLILLVVTLATSETTTIDESPGEIQVIVERQTERSPWTFWTGLALVPVAAGAAWWWAGRAVRPIDDIRSFAETLDTGVLDQRIGLETGTTEIKSLAASFDSMLDRLSAAAQLQTELLDEASHELRTPLAILRTNADVLLADPEPTIELYGDGLRRSRSVADRIAGLVDAMFLEARSRNRTIDRQPSDLVELAKVVANATTLLCDTKGVRVKISGPTLAPGRFDQLSVERALTNLLDNAIRYAPPASTIHIDIELLASGHTQIAVIDWGPGIPQEAQALVFDRGWTAEAGSRNGLGLTIARHIAHAHGGDLKLTSPLSQDGGTSFELRLPL